jgi:hypothetical protein
VVVAGVDLLISLVESTVSRVPWSCGFKIMGIDEMAVLHAVGWIVAFQRCSRKGCVYG